VLALHHATKGAAIMTTSVVDPREAVVLLVEDNPDNLFIFCDILRGDVGVKYCNARASGRQLFKLLNDNALRRPDLILLDISIPHEDGFTVHRKLRTFFEEMRFDTEPMVVAITANCMPETVERARREGFDGFIGKPIERSRFIQQINRILQGEAVWEPH
jgi:two-component system cell cycle response regulator DivK